MQYLGQVFAPNTTIIQSFPSFNGSWSNAKTLCLFYFYNVYKLLHTLKTQLVTLSTVKTEHGQGSAKVGMQNKQ